MSTVGDSVRSPRISASRTGILQLLVSRPLVYISCALLAVLTSGILGKEMQWDTLHYHFYAGFSAIHDRFGLDYFPAGAQSYLNPYVYAPFYLLATSGLTAFEVATCLALFHCAILWLTYELAIAVTPPEQSCTRTVSGVCAALFAFLNPVLIDQFGSSYADITTAELALAGCLLLVGSIRVPGIWRIVGSGALLGMASALKLTNGLTAASLMIVPLFLPVNWRARLGYTALLGLCIGVSFALISAPWSIRLEHHFGNPFFPLFNGLFRSPQYTTGADTDSLFIPINLGAAMWRPFAIASPMRMTHVEMAAPDLRYAILLVVAGSALLAWMIRSIMKGSLAQDLRSDRALRALLALGSAFILNWSLWLAMSGNSRYFLPMACAASVLVVIVLFRLMTRWPRLRNCVVAGLLVAQIYQLSTGSVFRPPLPWNKGPWFDVSVPRALASEPALYFSIGIQANAFIVPFLAPGSGIINLDGDYVLGPAGANGDHIRALIKRFSPRLRVLVFDPGVYADRDVHIPRPLDADDALQPFGLRVDEGDCAKITAPNTPKVQVVTFGRAIPNVPLSQWYVRYFVTCRVVPNGIGFGAVPPDERAANLVLDRLEDECPEVLRPRRPVTFPLNGVDNKRMWIRRYSNTHVSAWVSDGELRFQAMLGRDRVHNLGSVNEWETRPPPVVCGRRANGLYFLGVAPRP